MSKVFFDKDSIKNIVIPNINSSVNSINLANNTNFVVPRGFYYGNYLNNIFESNTKTKNNLNKQVKMLNNGVQEYKNMIINNSNEIASISNIKIAPGKFLVK